MHGLFGCKDISILPKEIYLEKIASKEFGGDKREVDFLETVINTNSATVKVVFTGKR